ncbi:MAG: tRNA (adenosine(37)-N6)-dimethylallyltransferase MiaA [Elusimicrobia bacterium]|nr:tRNA (adenosine(37)-N6)-dimethylallyltransferase MiaA [Elusimicrobiota bacterium]
METKIARTLAVVGPTASGKTELAIALARALDGEVVSADSRQLYRDFDAGTAKPPPDAGVPYHLVGVVDPTLPVSAGLYVRLARPVLDGIVRRGRVPIVAGGTGLYIRALLEGLADLPEGDPSVRKALEDEAAEHGLARLHARLVEVDPEAAARIPANNRQRLVRALEIHALTGRPISSYWRPRSSPDGVLYLSISWPARELRERISRRARSMWPGILDETRRLLERYTGREAAFQSLGYREALSTLEGSMTQDEGLELLIRSTHAYAKRQRTWFGRQVSALRIDGAGADAMLAAALKSLAPPAGGRVAGGPMPQSLVPPTGGRVAGGPMPFHKDASPP